jgi:hypothetical protein
MGVKKLYAKDIRAISAAKFKPVGEVKLGEEKISGLELKKYLEKEVSGGKTTTALEKSFKEAGLKEGQWEKRQALMGILNGGEDKNNGKPKPVPWYRRALATDDPEMTKKTGVSVYDARRGTSQVSVDTRAQGGRMSSSINPITGGVSSVNKNQRPPLAKPGIPLAR